VDNLSPFLKLLSFYFCLLSCCNAFLLISVFVNRNCEIRLKQGGKCSLEILWKELRKKHFHNRVFKSMDAVDDQLEIALRQMSENPARVKNFSAFHWMNL